MMNMDPIRARIRRTLEEKPEKARKGLADVLITVVVWVQWPLGFIASAVCGFIYARWHRAKTLRKGHFGESVAAVTIAAIGRFC